jgi:hypothetical protein
MTAWEASSHEDGGKSLITVITARRALKNKK